MAANRPGQAQTFRDRAAAGRQLARFLERHRGGDAAVLGLARGGVPVAAEIAASLQLPLDVIVVRKLGLPEQPELAVGAIAGGTRVLNEDVIQATALDETTLEQISAREGAELGRRERAYRGDRSTVDIRGRTAILVDDGLATGSSMLAAVRALRERGAGRVVVAVPVAPEETCEALRREADEVVCARTPQPFLSVGSWYDEFGQTSDAEVRELLHRGAAGGAR